MSQKTKVEASVLINAPAEVVWERVKAFDQVESYVPQLVKSSTVTGSGADLKRTCVMAEGDVEISEYVSAFSEEDKRLVYQVSGVPVPVQDMANEVQVIEEDGSARLKWTSTFVGGDSSFR